MTVEDFLEIEQIKQLRSRYSHYYDGLELEKYLDLFTENAVLEADEKHGGRVCGKEQLRLLVEPMMRSQKKYEMFHLVANPLIELVDSTHATGRWYLLDYNFRYAEDPFRVVCIYEDQYEKINGEWKFSRVHLNFLYPYRWPENL